MPMPGAMPVMPLIQEEVAVLLVEGRTLAVPRKRKTKAEKEAEAVKMPTA